MGDDLAASVMPCLIVYLIFFFFFFSEIRILYNDVFGFQSI